MDTGVKVSIIVAVAENGVIGRGGEIPWRLKSDLKRFKALTMSHTVVVGRKTHEAILKRLGHVLPGRRTIVMTRQKGYQARGYEVVGSWEDALALVRGEEEVFVIGGAEVYRHVLPFVARLYLTKIPGSFEGDAYFPDLDRDDWELESAEHQRPQEGDDQDFIFQVWRRRERLPATGSYLYLDHARTDDQRAVMERIASEGICPFCPEHRRAGEILEPLWRGKHWVLVPNRWPYKFTKLHLMAIPNRHVSFPHELGLDEWTELFEVLAWAITAHGIKGGSIGMRFGDPAMTGATVAHLHLQLIVADQDVTQPSYERVRFPMGPKPPEPKEEEKAPGS